MSNPNPCSICAHPDRVAIEAELRLPTQPQRTTADQYHTSKTTLLRHRDDCMGGERMSLDEVKQHRLATVAPTQIDRAGAFVAKVQLGRLLDEASTIREEARQLFYDYDGEDAELKAKLLKSWLDANGGGVQKVVELLLRQNQELTMSEREFVRILEQIRDAMAAHPEAVALMVDVVRRELAVIGWLPPGAVVTDATTEAP